MKKEYKELLIRDLCCRLQFKVLVHYNDPDLEIEYEDPEGDDTVVGFDNGFLVTNRGYDTLDVECAKPYLRPMSSMTNKERMELFEIEHIENPDGLTFDEARCIETNARIDWLDRKMFDHRGLIPKGLALEAKEGMYNV